MGDHLGFIDGLMARLHGPMSLRLLMQPLMAFFFAYRDGRKDAREGRPPYLSGLFSAPHRQDLLLSGWRSIGKVFVFAMILDTIFQFIVFHDFRPGRGLIAGVILAIVPYILLRGPVNRLWRRKGAGS